MSAGTEYSNVNGQVRTLGTARTNWDWSRAPFVALGFSICTDIQDGAQLETGWVGWEYTPGPVDLVQPLGNLTGAAVAAADG